MTTRRFALTLSAAAALLGAALTLAPPANAQGYYGHEVQRPINPYRQGYGAPPPPPPRVRPVDPYYGNRPSIDRRYGSGHGRHWRRWTGRTHPGYRPPGWDRPRAFDYGR